VLFIELLGRKRKGSIFTPKGEKAIKTTNIHEKMELMFYIQMLTIYRKL